MAKSSIVIVGHPKLNMWRPGSVTRTSLWSRRAEFGDRKGQLRTAKATQCPLVDEQYRLIAQILNELDPRLLLAPRRELGESSRSNHDALAAIGHNRQRLVSHTRALTTQGARTPD
jgi:hypothetical protein